MSVERFLTVLKEKDLVPDALLHVLNNQFAHYATAAEVAQMLIDKGYLTPVLVNRLMGMDIERRIQDADESGQDATPEQDIGFAPVQEEKEPRPVIGRHRPYKSDDSTKVSGPASPAAKGQKPPESPPQPPPPPKPSLLDKPPQSRWATSVYDRELDTSKGIVSPRLVKLAGIEQIPTTVMKSRRKRWLIMLIQGGIILGLAVIFYLLITMIFFQ